MNIDTKSISKLIMAIIAAVTIAACSSTDTDDSAASTSDMMQSDQSATSSAASDSSMSSESMDDDAMTGALKTVFYFDFDQSALSPETRAALDAQAKRLRNTSGAIRLEGHADERGTREYNLALGERRAKAVANYLAIQGVDRSRIENVSYGEEKPVALGHSEQSWSLNRRVELK